MENETGGEGFWGACLEIGLVDGFQIIQLVIQKTVFILVRYNIVLSLLG